MGAVLKSFAHNRKALSGLVIVAIIVALAVAAALLNDYDPTRRVGTPHQPPTWDH